MTNISHMAIICLNARPLLKTLNSQAQVSFPSRQHFARIVTHQIQHVLYSSTRRNSWKLVLGFLWTSPHALSASDTAWYSFALINHNHEYNNFQALSVTEPEGELEDSLTQCVYEIIVYFG